MEPEWQAPEPRQAKRRKAIPSLESHVLDQVKDFSENLKDLTSDDPAVRDYAIQNLTVLHPLMQQTLSSHNIGKHYEAGKFTFLEDACSVLGLGYDYDMHM